MTWVAQALNVILVVCGSIVLVFGLIKVIFVPLALAFDASERRRARAAQKRRLLEARLEHSPEIAALDVADGWWDVDSRLAELVRRHTLLDRRPFVSIVVPCYNEEAVLENCVRSILRSAYRSFEVILVDDGSTDQTPAVARALAEASAKVTVIRQRNAGKGAALNTGIRRARGEVFLFVDADGIFSRDTIARMLEGFSGPEVGAVCGDDRPVNLDRIQTRLLAVISHVGTGLVRRVLTVLGCLPIVSGNIGAFPRAVVDEVGAFRTDTIGEDLELTWRVHRAGYQVRFQPLALVRAESPSTVRDLWRQRVRWARGFLQSVRLHRDVIGNPRYGSFGLYSAFNVMSMIIVPCLQLLILILLPLAFATAAGPVSMDVVSVIAASGLVLSLVLLLAAIGLNRAWSDLRYLPLCVLWPVYSVFTALTMARALQQELTGRTAAWNKVERTGVITAA